jgi:hypothetical protein
MQHPNLSNLAVDVLLTIDLESIAPGLREIIYPLRYEFQNKITEELNLKDVTDSLERAI